MRIGIMRCAYIIISIFVFTHCPSAFGYSESSCTKHLSLFHSTAMQQLIRQKFDAQPDYIPSEGMNAEFGQGSVFVSRLLPIPLQLYRGVAGPHYTPHYIASILSEGSEFGIRSVALEKRIRQLAGQSPINQKIIGEAYSEIASAIENDISSREDISGFIAAQQWAGVAISPANKIGASVLFTSTEVGGAKAYAITSTGFFRKDKETMVPMLVYEIDSKDLAYIPLCSGQWLTPDKTTVLKTLLPQREVLVPGEIPLNHITSVYYGGTLVQEDLATAAIKWVHIKKVNKQWQVWSIDENLDPRSEVLLKALSSPTELESYLQSLFPSMGSN